MSIDDVVKDLLVLGEDDWVNSWLVYWADQSAASVAERVDSVIDVVDTLLQRGWMMIGGLGNHGFDPWDLPHDDALRRAREELERLGDDRMKGIAFWLANAELGDELARELIAQGHEPP